MAASLAVIPWAPDANKVVTRIDQNSRSEEGKWVPVRKPSSRIEGERAQDDYLWVPCVGRRAVGRLGRLGRPFDLQVRKFTGTARNPVPHPFFLCSLWMKDLFKLSQNYSGNLGIPSSRMTSSYSLAPAGFAWLCKRLDRQRAILQPGKRHKRRWRSETGGAGGKEQGARSGYFNILIMAYISLVLPRNDGERKITTREIEACSKLARQNETLDKPRSPSIRLDGFLTGNGCLCLGMLYETNRLSMVVAPHVRELHPTVLQEADRPPVTWVKSGRERVK
ncbi:hypothetical protein C8R44DRAFT_753221 [Mycena epipterygia]|nr:hypothetical protein C8R44DRAFT_753221 [Mycena epipterygia]